MLSNVKEINQQLTEVWSRQQHNIVNTDVIDCTVERKHLHLQAYVCLLCLVYSIFCGLNVLI